MDKLDQEIIEDEKPKKAPESHEVVSMRIQNLLHHTIIAKPKSYKDK